MLVILTTTGARPLAFTICQNLMARQSYGDKVTWIVVDDGEEPSPLVDLPRNWTRKVIRPNPFWRPGQNTQGRNLIAGLNAAEKLAGDKLRLVIVEDDDWYHEGWISFIADLLEKAELVGEGLARYYDVRRRLWQRFGNLEHASLRCSAMRDGALKTFREVLQTPDMFYDLKLWAQHRSKFVSQSRMTVGMKALPGRVGIGLGHEGRSGRSDHDGAVLREWVGEDYQIYDLFYERQTLMKNAVVVLKAHRYRTRQMVAGDIYVPDRDRDTKLLIAAKRVRPATAEEISAKGRTKPAPSSPPAKKVEQVQKAPDPVIETVAVSEAKPETSAAAEKSEIEIDVGKKGPAKAKTL